jgi:hypothetical protein
MNIVVGWYAFLDVANWCTEFLLFVKADAMHGNSKTQKRVRRDMVPCIFDDSRCCCCGNSGDKLSTLEAREVCCVIKEEVGGGIIVVSCSYLLLSSCLRLVVLFCAWIHKRFVVV